MSKRIAFFLPFLFLLILATVLVIIWFKEGYILGTAEGMLPFYNLTHLYNEVNLAWSDTNPGLGYANGIVTAYAPTFFILSVLEKFGFPNYIIEAFFMWFFLMAAGTGIILFTQELFPKMSRKYLFLAALFYWFNLLSLVNIWNRFLYGFIALWALLPLVSAIYTKGLRKQNFLYVFIIGIICAVFSLGLSNPVFNIVLWFVFSFITLFYFFTTKIKKSRIFYLLFFTLNLVYFCLVNLWWIGQVIRHFLLGKYSEELSTFFQGSVSLSSLTSSSQNLGDLTNLYRLLHKSFFTTPFTEWAKLYLGVGPAIIEFLLTIIMLLFIIKYKKNIHVIFLALLFTISLYLAKGSNPPFGNLFEFLFINITFLQIFRNPFEKFGFIIPLAFTPLLAAGLEDLSLRFKSNIRLAFYILLLFIVIGLFGYPFWSGLVFTGMFPPTNDYSVGYKVKVPEYYQQANRWLELQGQNFRFIGFPYNGQGVTYKWEKGFQGVETSMWLFSTPHIMFSTTILYFDKVADQLEELFIKQQDFYKVMNILNAKYVMVRTDVDFQERYMRNPQKLNDISKRISQEGELKEVSTFDKLTFWENPFWSDKILYAVSNLMKVSPNVKLGDFTLPEAASAGAAYKESLPDVDRMASLEIIHPDEPKDKSKSKPNVYKFDIKESGSYELIVNLPVIRVDQNKLENKPSLRAEDRYSYGSFKFDKGSHEIEVAISDNENTAVQSLNSNDYTILNFDPYAKYLIKFDYSTKEKKEVKLMIYLDNDQIRDGQPKPFYIRDLSLSSGDTFNSFQDIVEPKNTSSTIRIHFSLEQTNLVVKNMIAKKITSPDLLLIRKIENISQKIPELSYTKINPTRYKINIKNSEEPFVLIFSSTFNPGWEIIYPDNSKPKDHFLVNSFANGWLIDRVGEYDLTLNYALQDSLEMDSRISFISFAGGILIIAAWLILRKFN